MSRPNNELVYLRTAMYLAVVLGPVICFFAREGTAAVVAAVCLAGLACTSNDAAAEDSKAMRAERSDRQSVS